MQLHPGAAGGGAPGLCRVFNFRRSSFRSEENEITHTAYVDNDMVKVLVVF